MLNVDDVQDAVGELQRAATMGLAGALILVITFIRYLTRQPRPKAPEPPLGTIAY